MVLRGEVGAIFLAGQRELRCDGRERGDGSRPCVISADRTHVSVGLFHIPSRYLHPPSGYASIRVFVAPHFAITRRAPLGKPRDVSPRQGKSLPRSCFEQLSLLFYASQTSSPPTVSSLGNLTSAELPSSSVFLPHTQLNPKLPLLQASALVLVELLSSSAATSPSFPKTASQFEPQRHDSPRL